LEKLKAIEQIDLVTCSNSWVFMKRRVGGPAKGNKKPPRESSLGKRTELGGGTSLAALGKEGVSVLGDTPGNWGGRERVLF